MSSSTVRPLRPPPRRLAAVTAVSLALAAGSLAGAPAGSAAPAAPRAPRVAPAAADIPPAGPVTAVVAPTAQANHTVYASLIVGGRIFIGGDFTSIRPSGKGTTGVVRSGFAVLSATTGALLATRHTFTATAGRPRVQALALSSDRTVLYVGGTFAAVDGLPRHNLAAVSVATGALLPGFGVVGVNGSVFALTTVGSSVYAGGTFSRSGTTPRARLAAFSPAGTLRPFDAVLSGNAKAGGPVRVLALDSTPNHRVLLVGGAFDKVDGGGVHGFDGLDPVTGARLPYASNVGLPGTAYVTTIIHDATQVYLGARDDLSLTTARFEGFKALRAAGGGTVWTDYCYGDTFALLRLKGSLFIGSHAHDCSAIDGWPETNPRHYQSIFAVDPATGALQSFYPQLRGTPKVEGSQNSMRTFATDGTQVFAGGGWTTIDGRASQDVARFLPTGPGMPPGVPGAGVALVKGRPVVTFHTVGDDDNTALTYRVYRLGASTPFAVRNLYSTFWNNRPISIGDPGGPTGSRIRYYVTVSDGTNLVRSATTDPVKY